MTRAARGKDVRTTAALPVRTPRPADAPQTARLDLASSRAGYRDLLPTAFLAGLTLADRERRWRARLG